MPDAAPDLWLVITTAAASGLLASLIGHALLALPLVRVKVRHELHIDSVVANIRGRDVTIEHAYILKRRHGRGPGMGRPKGWTFPHSLSEGQVVRFTFDRRELPNAVAVAMDTAERVWPRRRRPLRPARGLVR